MIGAVMIAALLVVTAGGAYVGAAVIARHRAQAAADLVALAGAARIPGGAHIACAQASSLARAMGTVAVACAVDGLDVVVTVEASRSLGLTQMQPARAVARAGPAGAGSVRVG